MRGEAPEQAARKTRISVEDDCGARTRLRKFSGVM
jgi:hypothetical protein